MKMDRQGAAPRSRMYSLKTKLAPGMKKLVMAKSNEMKNSANVDPAEIEIEIKIKADKKKDLVKKEKKSKKEKSDKKSKESKIEEKADADEQA